VNLRTALYPQHSKPSFVQDKCTRAHSRWWRVAQPDWLDAKTVTIESY